MSGNFDVGYGRPPRHTQFSKGTSGNPNGRPKGTNNFKTDLTEELGEQILLREGHREVRISKQRALIKSQLAKAIKGDTRAATWIFNLVNRIMDFREAEATSDSISAEDRSILKAWQKQQSQPDRGEEIDE